MPLNSYVHVETLFGSSLPEVFGLFLLILEPGFLFESLLFFSFEVEILIGWFKIVDEIGFGILKSVFHHASHSVKLLCLLGVQVLFVFLLFSPLSFLFDLLVEPLFLFGLKELSSCIILCIDKENYWGLRLRISDIQRYHHFVLDGDIHGKRFTWSSSLRMSWNRKVNKINS